MKVQRANRKSFKLDLAGLHAICEANYARMLRLFPGYENTNSREFMVGEARVRLEVIERCRYTTIFHLYQQQSEARWLGRLRVEVRAGEIFLAGQTHFFGRAGEGVVEDEV